jgi:hypothetical protein
MQPNSAEVVAVVPLDSEPQTLAALAGMDSLAVAAVVADGVAELELAQGAVRAAMAAVGIAW